jgi:hypothetical protein
MNYSKSDETKLVQPRNMSTVKRRILWSQLAFFLNSLQWVLQFVKVKLIFCFGFKKKLCWFQKNLKNAALRDDP